MNTPDAPKEDPETKAMRARQIEQLAELDDQQNTRIKRMFNARFGTRSYAGSPMSRGRPSNTAGKPLYAPRGVGGGGVAGGASAPYGGRGGSARVRGQLV